MKYFSRCHLLLTLTLCQLGLITHGQSVIFIGDIPGGNHRSESRAVASLNDGRDLLVVGGSEGENGWELTTFTTGDETTPPELFIHPDAPGSPPAPAGSFKVISEITPDGQWVVGRQHNAEGQTAAFISDPFGENFSWLTDLPIGGTYSRSRATGISDDASRIVGTGRDENGTARAVYWDNGFIGWELHYLPLIEGYGWSAWAYDISGDGQVLVGYTNELDESFNLVGESGFVWTEASGMQLLSPPPEWGFSYVLKVSADGSLAGGDITSEDGLQTLPAYWTIEDLQPHLLPIPPGFESGSVDSFSADGSLVTGTLYDADESHGNTFRAALWDLNQPGTVQFFEDWALQHGCSFNGAVPFTLNIHADGETFYGMVVFPETGAVEGYVAQIDYSPTDLTIIGRLPYPDDRTQSSNGDKIWLRDINPKASLATGQGNFYESMQKTISIPMYWTPETGLREISPLGEGSVDDWMARFGRGYDVTPDGNFMIGQNIGLETWGFGYVWDRSLGSIELPVSSIFEPVDTDPLSPGMDYFVREQSRALGISDGGNLVVGQVNSRGRGTTNRAAYWEEAGEVQLLPIDQLGTVLSSYATDVSGDGSVIAGWVFVPSEIVEGTVTRAVVWVDKVLTELPIPEGFSDANTWDISHDGSTLAGIVYNVEGGTTLVDVNPIIWDVGGTYQLLELPEGWTAVDMNEVNFDGSAATGVASTESGNIAYVWDRDRGIFEVKDYLESVCGLSVGPYTISRGRLNDEGTHIIGAAEGKYGEFAFFVELPEEFQPEAAKYLWRTAPPRDDPYRFIEGFGWLYDNGTYPWVWHTEHGWIYTIGTDPTSFLMFDSSLQGWWQVDMAAYSWMYKLANPAGWFYYYAPYGSPGGRFFYDPSSGQSKLETELFPQG